MAAFVLAAQAFGLLIIALTANLRKAVSLGALIFGPAAAFSGVTFPLAAMPVGPRIWAETLPAHARAWRSSAPGSPSARPRPPAVRSWR